MSKPIRFRKAVLGLTVIDTDARKLTIEDVTAKWTFLSSSGYPPKDILVIGNSDDIADEVFVRLMNSLNSYL